METTFNQSRSLCQFWEIQETKEIKYFFSFDLGTNHLTSSLKAEQRLIIGLTGTRLVKNIFQIAPKGRLLKAPPANPRTYTFLLL